MKECDKIKNLFGSYLYGDVTPDERIAVEDHIARCKKCAEDLRSRQEILKVIMPRPLPDRMPESAQDNFVWNVYRRIVGEALRQQPRQMFLRRFVMQPTIAALALAVGVAIGSFWLHPPASTIMPGPSIVTTGIEEPSKESSQPTVRVEGVTNQRKQTAFEQPSRISQKVLVAKSKTPNVGSPAPTTREDKAIQMVSTTFTKRMDLTPEVLLSNLQTLNLQDQLADADFINYSLRDPRRALAAYQRIVEDYPDTNAAADAKERINAILNPEYEIHVKHVSDIGIQF